MAKLSSGKLQEIIDGIRLCLSEDTTLLTDVIQQCDLCENAPATVENLEVALRIRDDHFCISRSASKTLACDACAARAIVKVKNTLKTCPEHKSAQLLEFVANENAWCDIKHADEIRKAVRYVESLNEEQCELH